VSEVSEIRATRSVRRFPQNLMIELVAPTACSGNELSEPRSSAIAIRRERYFELRQRATHVFRKVEVMSCVVSV
jgi:hypothetical protein